MSQPIAGPEVVTSTDPEVEQATPEVVLERWNEFQSGLEMSRPRFCDGNLPCKKPKNILSSKRGLFYTLLAISLLGILGGLASGFGGELASLKSSSNSV